MSMMISPYIRTIYKSIIFLEKNKDSEALFTEIWDRDNLLVNKQEQKYCCISWLSDEGRLEDGVRWPVTG